MRGAPRFELDAAVRRRDGGRLLVGGTPPRLVRLSEAGRSTLDALLAGGAGDNATRSLARRLERGGLIHPVPLDEGEEPEVTAIVPVLNGGPRLGELVAGLAAEGPVIVVDDGSSDGSAALARAAGASVISHPAPRGPAAARNAGLRAARSEVVALLDADCEVRPGWRRGLAPLLLADPDLALIGPRVRGAPGESTLAHYEELSSPLDLGPHPSLVGAARRVTYLPAAALLARREALLAVGGFDETMRFGEDVDLVWRLGVAGRTVRYVPAREVEHRPRATAGDLARQRAGYGASAPELVRRHGALAAPLQASLPSAATWTAVGFFGIRALPPALAMTTALVARRGDDLPTRTALAELALRGQADAAGHLRRVLVREWLPLTLATATLSRRARIALAAALISDSLPLWRHPRSTLEAPHLTALRLLDYSAYAFGLWREAYRHRSAAALIPSLLRGGSKRPGGETG